MVEKWLQCCEFMCGFLFTTVKEWRILEWSLPHSRWRRSFAWLVGKSRPETIAICEKEEGQFEDVDEEVVDECKQGEDSKSNNFVATHAS